jgi:transcriptional regulator with PAS, ATPase and Fis domain
MVKEVWKQIRYGKKFEISNKGNIRHIENQKNRRFSINKQTGVCTIDLGKSMPVHKIVAEHFISNPNNYEYIKHIDGNKQNNSIENLKWDTLSEIVKESRKNNLRSDQKQIICKNLETNREITYNSLNETARQLNISPATLYRRIRDNQEIKGLLLRYK